MSELMRMNAISIYGVLADTIAFSHLLYVMFVVFGQLLILVGWAFHWQFVRHFWFRVIHLISIAIVAVQEMKGILCPLTVLEYYFRNLAGQNVNTDLTFLMRIFRSLVFITFPDWVYTLMYIGFAVIVLGTMFIIPPRIKGAFSKQPTSLSKSA